MRHCCICIKGEGVIKTVAVKGSIKILWDGFICNEGFFSPEARKLHLCSLTSHITIKDGTV